MGTFVAATTRKEAASQVLDWALDDTRAYAVEAADVHVITRARHEADFREVIDAFDLVCPDGMPLVWLLNSQLSFAERLRERVSGAELMAETLHQSESRKEFRHFLLGGSEALLNALQDELAIKYPRTSIAAVYSPPFGEWPNDEFERICQKIRESGANLIWVGLGCPKQESWIANNKHLLPAGVYFGVGAAFAFHAGKIARAPYWVQKIGMEWFYRVLREPRRLFRRYFVYNSLFLKYFIRDVIAGEQ